MKKIETLSELAQFICPGELKAWANYMTIRKMVEIVREYPGLLSNEEITEYINKTNAADIASVLDSPRSYPKIVLSIILNNFPGEVRYPAIYKHMIYINLTGEYSAYNIWLIKGLKWKKARRNEQNEQKAREGLKQLLKGGE
jgi:hypothetical protein